ncbi:MAG: tyrosine-protein phosphatase [Steroidobacter sp.]
MNASISTLREQRARVLSFEGGCNFRDIGGYRTQEDRCVRWGRVYRTGVLSYFTANDHRGLVELGVRAICDLRRADERDREPTRWPDAAAEALHWNDGSIPPTLHAFAANRPNTAAGMFDAMVELYRALPAWMGERISGMFECLAAGRTPLVVHCAAGKDRTGLAVAVLLRALGVPRETVIHDYLLTNDVGDFEQFIRARHAAQLGLADAQHPLLAMPEDVRRVLFSADAAFLETAFEEIDTAHGGLDAYLEHTAGVTAARLARVRDALLE